MAIIIGTTVREYQDADQAITSSTALVNTELSIPIAASQKFMGKFVAYITLAGAASGAKFQLIVPAGGTLYRLGWEIHDNAAAAPITNTQLASAAFSNALAAAANYYVEGLFTVHNGATAGNVILQFAQLVSDAGAATFLAGSWMEVTKF